MTKTPPESSHSYQARIPIFPRSVKGRFRTLKTAILVMAYGVYFLLPWLRWERDSGPSQAVLFDITGRKFYLFDLIVYAQDIFWLAGLLIIAAWLMFFVTGVAGRVFCGYFCFQTLWTDVFIAVERLVQGDRNARIRLSKAPWGAAKLAKLGTTHLLWIGVALLTGLTFTLYWADAPTLVAQMVRGSAPFPAYATTLFLTATTYVMAGLAREQVCTYMCPYARFQSAMFDRDTLIVGYDGVRGERQQGRHKPAAALKTQAQRIGQGYGDCIDCGYCVQVCPTGIDIRNGLQIQCISCALCIDACNTIMDSVGYPRGLIRYSSENQLQGKKTRIIKPKTLGYGIGLIAAIALLASSVANRAAVELSVVQVRNPLHVTLSDGRVQNRYEIKLMNKTAQEARYRLSIQGLAGAELDVGQFEEVNLAPEGMVRVVARVRMDPEEAAQSQQKFYFVADPLGGTGEHVQWESVFYIPEAQMKRQGK